MNTRSKKHNAWTNPLERKFSKLVALHALGKASPEQNKELDHLQTLRRKLKNPMSPQEITRARKRQQMENKIIESVARYVSLLQNGGKHHS
jgi:hypothetical protein